ncbi:putative uncharacterized protein [Clostridium sp. CAG:793]|nr:putative uncharacterized protein [Clostridium sp. CAG:793]
MRDENKAKRFKRDEQDIDENIQENSKRRKHKSHKALKIIGIIILIIVILCVCLAGAGYLYISNKLGKLNYETISKDANDLGISSENADKKSEMSKYRNIALLGLDSRYDTYDEDYRTDCIMIASINQETNEVTLYSIYRDTYVQMTLDGTTKFDKINHAYYNGVQNTIKTINENLDLNISEYVTVDFNAVSDLVDSVGGIDVNIDNEEIQYINNYIKDVTKVTGKTADKITKTGVNHLNGVQAVSYCRIRYTTGKDYKRTERMRTVLEKVFEKAKKKSIPELNSILETMLPKIRTNLTAMDITSLIPTMLNITIKESFGWPYKTTGVWMRGDFYGPASSLESNVKKLHKEVYGQEDYEVPDNIKEISNQIIKETGVKDEL